jgi:hypothetical protein
VISQIADAVARVEARAQEVQHLFEGGFEPDDARSVRRATTTLPSLDPLSVAAPDGAYFVALDERGRSIFTRDGVFSFADGTLRGRDGSPVLGFRDDAGKPAPLRADPLDVALGRVAGARLERDGSLTYERSLVDPRSGERRVERVVVGRVALGRFSAGTQPLRRDPTHVVAPSGVQPMLGRAGDNAFGSLTTFARDLGRLDPLAGLDRLEEAYLSFEAIRAAGAAHGGLERTALDLVK